MKKHSASPHHLNLHFIEQLLQYDQDCTTSILILEPRTIDSQRKFTDSQKKTMLNRQQNTCNTFDAKVCAFYITLENSEGDHITRHSNYGPTTLRNGQMLCIDCHKKKTSQGL